MNNILTIAQRNARDAAAFEREIEAFLHNLTIDNAGEQVAVLDQFMANAPENIVDKVLTNTFIKSHIKNLSSELLQCDCGLLQSLTDGIDHDTNVLYGQLVEIVHKNIMSIKNAGVSFLYFLFGHHQVIFYKLTEYASKKSINELAEAFIEIKKVVTKNSTATDPSTDESLNFVLDHLERCIYDALVFHMTNSSTRFDIFRYPSVLSMACQNNQIGTLICEKYKLNYQGYLEEKLNDEVCCYDCGSGMESLAYLIFLTKNDDELKRLVTESLFQKDSNGISLLLSIFKIVHVNSLKPVDAFISIYHSIGEESHWLSFFQEFLSLVDTEQDPNPLVTIMTSLPRLFACLFELNSNDHHSIDLTPFLDVLRQGFSTRIMHTSVAQAFSSLLKELLQQAKENASLMNLIEQFLSIDAILDKQINLVYSYKNEDLIKFIQSVATEFPHGGIDRLIRAKVKQIISNNNSDHDRYNSRTLIRDIFENNPTYFWQLCDQERDVNNAYTKQVTDSIFDYTSVSSSILFQSVSYHLPEFLKFISKMDNSNKKKLLLAFNKKTFKNEYISQALVEQCPTHMLFIAIHLHEENCPGLPYFLCNVLLKKYFKISFPDYINFIRDNFDRFFSSEDIVIKLLGICPEDIHFFIDKAPDIATKMICKPMDDIKRYAFIHLNPAALLAILVWLKKNQYTSSFDSWQSSLKNYLDRNMSQEEYSHLVMAFYEMNKFAPQSIKMLKSTVTSLLLTIKINTLLRQAGEISKSIHNRDVNYSTKKMREDAQRRAASASLFSQQSATSAVAVDSRPAHHAP